MSAFDTTTVSAGPPALFPLRSALLFSAPMMVNGIALLYFPAMLHDLGMSDVEIGLILSLPFLLRMIGMPAGAAIADRVPDRVLVLIASAVVSFATAVAMLFTHSFWPIVIFYGIQSLFYAPFVPIAEATLVTGVRRWGYDYGFLRLWGSVAFVGSTMLGGWLLDLYGGAMVVPAMTVFFGLTTLVAIVAPRLGRPKPSTSTRETRPAADRSAFWKTDFLLVIGGAALVQGSHALLFGFGTVYWKGLGISGFEISLLWSIAVVAEIVLFWVSGPFLARFGSLSLVLFGSIAALFRWSLFPLVDGFWLFLGLQMFHAFTFAIIHVGIQRFLMDRIGEERGASAQGFYQVHIGIINAVTAWASGHLFQAYGVQGFHAMTLVASAGVVCVVAAMVLQPQRALSGG